MTKKIRVENADTSDWKVTVQIWNKGNVLPSGSIEPDFLAREVKLDYPAEMAEVFIHSTQYIVIKEL